MQNASVSTIVIISALTWFPDGTILWSAPPVPGFSPSGIVQAVPSPYGPTSYSFAKSSDGAPSLVQAFTSNGHLLWQDSGLPLPYGGKSVPDGNEGLIVMGACNTNTSTPMSVNDVGAGSWTATLTSSTPGGCPSAMPNVGGWPILCEVEAVKKPCEHLD